MSPADRIWALVSGLPSPKRERRLIMALQAYVDDSGGIEENQHPYFVLAGLLADVERWASFSAEWQAVLDLEPRLEYFKMSEANSLQGQFGIWRGWTRELMNERVDEFTEVIRRNAIFRVSAAVNKAEFYRQIVSVKLKKAVPAAGNPYFLAFHKIVLGLPLRQALNGPMNASGAKIDFIFDDQDRTGTRANEAWDRIKNNILPKFKMRGVPNVMPFLGSRPMFKNEKEFLPLQGADLYAWYVRKHRQNNRILFVMPDNRLARLFEIPGDDAVYDRAEIMELRFDGLELQALDEATALKGAS